MRIPIPESVSFLRGVLRMAGLRQMGVLVVLGSISSSPIFSQTNVDFSGLKIVMCNESAASPRILKLAESTATEILGHAVFPVTWWNVPSEAAHQPGSVCESGTEPDEVRVRILWHRPKGEFSDNIFGVATFPNTVTLYYELVNRVARSDNADHEKPILLGALIAHEVGHLLLGPGSHSATGIMQPHWDQQQIRQAMMGRLAFSGDESVRIQKHAKERFHAESMPTSAGGGACCSNPATPQLSSISQRAEAGDPQAQYQLGSFYMSGTDVQLDYRQAAAWYRKAAEQHHGDAEFALGYMYEQGKGVKRDYREARQYYTAAAQQGHATAANNLGSLYEHGKGVRKNIRQAAEWYRKAADQGEVVAQCNLASLYFRGKGIPQDYVQAASWFRAAADRNYPPAQENLASMYYTGTGVKLDFNEAAMWVRRAALLGYARAQVDLAYLYEQGKGVPLDHVTAYMWYKVAAAAGERQAIAKLKILSPVMTEAQIRQATAAAAELNIAATMPAGASGADSVGSSWLP